MLLLSTIQAAPKPARNDKRSAKPKNRPGVHPTGAKNPSGQQKRSSNAHGKSKRQFPYFIPGNSVYPNYYFENPSPLIDFQNSFLQAAFLSGAQFQDTSAFLKKQNLTDAKALTLDAKTLAAFESAFGDKNGTSDLKAKILTFDGLGNVNIVNPFLLAKDFEGKGLPSVKAGKLGDANSSVVSLVNLFRGGHFDPVFGPELSPRYEIHYHPAGFTLDPLPPFGGAGPSFPPAAIGPLPQFDVAPSFNTLINPYPYPYPFLPGFDPKSLKPNGKTNGSNKPGAATEQ